MSFIDFRSKTFETGHATKPSHNFAINMLSTEVIFVFILIAIIAVLNSRKNKTTDLISCDLTETKY